MRSDPDPGDPPIWLADGPGQARLTIKGDNASVREGLSQLMTLQAVQALSEDSRGTLEIVLAEALNNVVEHAYRDGPGPIHISIDHLGSRLKVSIRDEGLAMPDLQVPKGKLKPLIDGEEQPEGGFGWALIRMLTQDLEYCRHGQTNHLWFALAA
jgi:serine/threonine-protein kinase RsbW